MPQGPFPPWNKFHPEHFPPRTFSTPYLFHPELLDLIHPELFPPQPFATVGPRMKNVLGWKMSYSGKSSGWKRSGVENVRGGTCPRVEKVPEPLLDQCAPCHWLLCCHVILDRVSWVLPETCKEQWSEGHAFNFFFYLYPLSIICDFHFRSTDWLTEYHRVTDSRKEWF